jgi:hypothetical protein
MCLSRDDEPTYLGPVARLDGKNLVWLAGQPIQIFPKNTKETPCKQSGLAKKIVSEKKKDPLKEHKKQKKHKTNYGNHPLLTVFQNTFFSALKHKSTHIGLRAPAR